MNHKFSASTLRIILAIVLFLIIAGGVTGFVFIRDILVKQAQEAARDSATASNSQDKLQNLKNAQALIDANEDVEQKVYKMLASSGQYAYQEELLKELKKIGAPAGVKVTNIDYQSVTPVVAATPADAAGAQGSTPAAPNASSGIPANVQLIQANVTISTPLRYDNLLRFIRYIEQNTLTMKVSKLSLSSAGKSEGDSLLVNCDVLTIGVYTQ